MEGECNVVRFVFLLLYELVSEKDVIVLKMKRDVLVVCLVYLIVIWIVVFGL